MGLGLKEVIIMYLKNKINIILALAIMGVCTACGNVKYVSTGSVVENVHAALQGRDIVKSAVPKEKRDKKDKHYGALVVASNNENEENTVYYIKKNKDKIYAETLLFDGATDKNSTFDKSYFSVGADKKYKSFGLRFRFEY